MSSDRLSTLRERKGPSLFTDHNAEEVDHYIRSRLSSSRTTRARNAPPGPSSAHETTDVSSSSSSPPLPRVDMAFLIINKTSPSYILGYKEGTVYYPSEGGTQERFPASQISTKDGVTYVQQVYLSEYGVDYTKLPYWQTEILFDAEDVWNSTIKTAKKLGIAKPTHLANVLKPSKRGKSDLSDRDMTIAGVTYHWIYDKKAKSYLMTGEKKDSLEYEVICQLQLQLNRNLFGSNLRGATLTIYDYNNYSHLQEALISCAVIFLNDWKKYIHDRM